jgi:hypothetical protein
MDPRLTTALGNKLSGTQNMLLGLSYPIVQTSPNPPGIVVLPAGTGTPKLDSLYYKVNVTTPAGPVDFASVKPDGTFEQLAAYFEPTASQIYRYPKDMLPSNNWGGDFGFPVVVDPFSDGLPILYYRRTVGVENPAAVGMAGSVTPAPGYYFDENREYTGSPNSAIKLPSTSGASFYQNTANTAIPGPQYKFDAGDLNKCVSVDGTATGKVRGGFVLISAGIDRYYGTVTTNGVAKYDDIVQVGGD